MSAGTAAAVLDAPQVMAPLCTADVADEHGTRRVEYVTAAEITNNMPGVTAARLRDWIDPNRPGGPILAAVTVAELAAEVYHLAVDNHQPARVPSRHGPMNVYRLHQVRAAERRTRRAPRGRKRTGQYAAGDSLLPDLRRRPALGERVIAVAMSTPEGVLEHLTVDELTRRHGVTFAAPAGITVRLCGAAKGDPAYSLITCQLHPHGRDTPHESRTSVCLHLWADDPATP